MIEAQEPGAQPRGRVPTGIEGFDAIADGGLPRGGITVVMGGAGAGKTIFGLQVLAARAGVGEAGILVAFEEQADRILANTAGFSWGGEPLKGAIDVLDAQLSRSVEASGAFDLIGLLAIVAAKARKAGAKLVVFDGLDVLLDHLGDASLARREIFRIRDWIHESGLTALVTAKTDGTEANLPADYGFLQFMADCVVTMHHRVVHGTATRSVRVSKYRGARHSSNEFPVTISAGGLEVVASTTSNLAHAASMERVSTGVERLDAMLSGGYYRGSSVLITGVPGTAKTTLAAAFAEASARRGERTLYVSFDEAPDQIVRNVASVGIQLGPLIAAGTLHVASFRARAENPEAHVARIREVLRERKPRNLVIDPLSALARSGVESDAAAMEILDFAKSAGITIVNTSLLGNTLPLAEQTPLNVSTIADVWLHVSYLSQAGERNRALTIVKARGTGHSNQVRELVLSDSGITLADVYAVGGEVLMGTLRWEKENDARRSRSAAMTASALRVQKVEQAIAETESRLETLARERSVQEVELAQIRADAVEEVGHRASAIEGLLQRRKADPAVTSSPPVSSPPPVGAQ